MPVESVEPEGRQANPAQFRTTHWSLVIRASATSDEISRQALEQLCHTYWPAVYAFIVRRGYSPEDAKDFTQGFFERLLEKEWLRTADSAKGRFRAFLLTAVTRYLSNERERLGAQKRGGGVELFSLNHADTETGFTLEPAATGTPEQAFERQWAESLLSHVMDRLRQEFEVGGRAGRFEQLKAFLTDDRGEIPYADVASKLAISESAVKSSIHRLRTRYGELVREEIANTVDSPEEVAAEIRHLVAVLGS